MAARLRAMTGTHWIVLFALVLGGWIALYAMSIPAELRSLSRLYGAEFWAELCRVTPDAAGFARLLFMWVLMSAAMMLPTALPAFATFDDLPSTPGGFARLVGGYTTIWLGFSVLAAAAQLLLFSLGAVDVTGLSQSRFLTAGLLVAAGAYQFSPLKASCLSKCRAPLPFFMQHWDEGPWRIGLRLGAVCLGCCWALMLLAFVGGVMSLAFMGLATLIMVFEKLPELGAWITRPLGFILIASGGAVLLGF